LASEELKEVRAVYISTKKYLEESNKLRKIAESELKLTTEENNLIKEEKAKLEEKVSFLQEKQFKE
jgi:hypothetical protein